MSDVTNTETIAREAGRWDPHDIAFVRRVSFDNWHGDSFDLVLDVLIQPRPSLSAGWPDVNGKFWEATIAFRGVRDLLLTICGPWDIQTPGFALEDIRDRQWDGQNLLVYDYERLAAEGIRFGAKSAEVLSCRPAEQPPRSLAIWREFPGAYEGGRGQQPIR